MKKGIPLFVSLTLGLAVFSGCATPGSVKEVRFSVDEVTGTAKQNSDKLQAANQQIEELRSTIAALQEEVNQKIAAESRSRTEAIRGIESNLATKSEAQDAAISDLRSGYDAHKAAVAAEIQNEIAVNREMYERSKELDVFITRSDEFQTTLESNQQRLAQLRADLNKETSDRTAADNTISQDLADKATDLRTSLNSAYEELNNQHRLLRQNFVSWSSEVYGLASFQKTALLNMINSYDEMMNRTNIVKPENTLPEDEFPRANFTEQDVSGGLQNQ